MASPVTNKELSSSTQNSSSTSNQRDKAVADFVAWSAAHKDDPPHRQKIERKPGDKSHRGPIRITSKDGVLTEYGKKLEQERLARLSLTPDVPTEPPTDDGTR